MARGSRALHRHMKRPDEPDVRLDAPPEVSVPRSAQRRPRAPHRRCDFGESARSAAEALGATAVDAVNGPSRSGPRAAPSGDSRGHAGVSMASSLSISLARCVLALDRSARPLPSRAAARAARPAVRRSSACPAGLPVGARSVAADVYGSHAAQWCVRPGAAQLHRRVGPARSSRARVGGLGPRAARPVAASVMLHAAADYRVWPPALARPRRACGVARAAVLWSAPSGALGPCARTVRATGRWMLRVGR